MADKYSNSFYPLESSPEIFTKLTHRLGVDEVLKFVDILSLEDDSLATLPAHISAVIVIYPEADGENVPINGFGHEHITHEEKNEVVWARQTSYNTCGLYAIFHAACNGEARKYIGKLLCSTRFRKGGANMFASD